MFSLTSRDQLLIVAVLVTTVIGAAVKHWRDARRENPVAAVRHRVESGIHPANSTRSRHPAASVAFHAP